MIIISGAGTCFSSGYDLSSDVSSELPYHTGKTDGFWPRHVVEGAFKIWDLSKPVIAQVHGYCLAGGTELATSCDLVYVSKDAEIGYPVVRSMSPPDNQFFPWLMGLRNAMEMMLTGESISGKEAVEKGFANRCFNSENLEVSSIGPLVFLNLILNKSFFNLLNLFFNSSSLNLFISFAFIFSIS